MHLFILGHCQERPNQAPKLIKLSWLNCKQIGLLVYSVSYISGLPDGWNPFNSLSCILLFLHI